MGNRIHGFLAGVALTGSLAITSASYIRGNLAFVSTNLRDLDNTINNRILSDRDIDSNPQPPNRRVAMSHRPSFAETGKDIWNEEIIKMVNWVYSINWYQWGLDADRKLNKLTDKVALLAVEEKANK